jgi:hypothetical protein
MMKKFLVLALVLGIAGLANAGYQLSMNGLINGEGNQQEITIKPSETILVDITAAYGPLDAPGNFWLGIEPVQGSAEWIRSSMHVYGPVAGSPALALSDGGYGELWIKGDNDNAPPAPGSWISGTLFDVIFHCTGAGDVMINLYDPAGSAVIDSILVHQIPEPMTMLLLGLGGLFLRKK